MKKVLLIINAVVFCLLYNFNNELISILGNFFNNNKQSIRDKLLNNASIYSVNNNYQSFVSISDSILGVTAAFDTNNLNQYFLFKKKKCGKSL
ncbi:MAG: COG2 family protein [Salinivirgaceae bacterium]|nr:COG2 family protein [Salinivirgaceae bacterium]